MQFLGPSCIPTCISVDYYELNVWFIYILGKIYKMSFTPISTIGIVADIRRDGECDHVVTKCSVFGINEDEYNSLASVCQIRPKFFTEEAQRYMVHCR